MRRALSLFGFALVGVVSSSFVAVTGCSSSTDSQGASPGQDGGTSGETGTSTAACTPIALGAVNGIPQGQLLDVAADAQGSWLLVRGTDTKRALTIVRPNGETHVLEQSDVTSAALASRSDGKVCAAWGVSKPTSAVRYACGPDFAAVDIKVELEISDDAPLSFRDGPNGAALLFEGRFAALDGIRRMAHGTWLDANVNESSISYPGSTRALSGPDEGSPYCFVANQSQGPAPIVVESWLRSGSANDWGVLALPEKTAANACGVALSGSKLGVLATGGGKAVFATADTSGEFASPLVPEAFEAPGITTWDLAADENGFTIVYASDKGAFRTTRDPTDATWQTSPLTIPATSPVTRVGLAKSASTEHIVVQTADSTYYGRNCP